MLHSHVFRDLAVFVEVAERRSFSKAAAALDMPISSVSRRIRALEETLAVRLLERTTRRLQLTRDGEVWLPQIARLVTEADRMIQQIRERDASRSNVLTVGVPNEPWAVEGLARALASDAFASEVRLRFALGTEPDPSRTGELDLTLTSGSPASADPRTHAIGSVETALFASPDYVAANGEPDRPDELPAHRIILSTDRMREIWTLTRRTDSVCVAVSGAIATGSAALSLRLATTGNGIVAADFVAAGIEMEAGRLVRVLPEWSLPRRSISMTRGERPLSPAAGTFVASIARTFAASLVENVPRRNEVEAFVGLLASR